MKSLHLFALLFLISTFIRSQDICGIEGKVTDKSNNEPLIGATVFIEGTTKGASADIDGRFSIRTDPGTYCIVINYYGYYSERLENIFIGKGEIKEVEIALSPEAKSFDTLIVEVERSRGDAGFILEAIRKQPGMSSGIPKDVITASGSSNAGGAVKLVTGATIQENKFVLIRGLNDRYNMAMINGMPLPSSEPDRRAFSFDIFPSSMLENLMINKSATPDLPGDFAGGIIQLNTRDVPSRYFFTFSAGTGFNDLSTGKPYSSGQGGKQDWLGIDDGSRDVPAGLPDTEELKVLLSRNETKYEYSSYFRNNWKISEESSTRPFQSYQAAIGNKFPVGKNEIGLIANLLYSGNRKTSVTERKDFEVDGTEVFSYLDNQFKRSVLAGGMLNLTYKMRNHKFTFRNMVSVNGEDQTVEREGNEPLQDRQIRSSLIQFSSSRLLTSQLSGEHFLPQKGIKIAWDGALNRVTRDLPDLRRMLYFKNITPQDSKTDTVWTAYIPMFSASPNYAGKFYSSLNENLYAGGTNIKIPFTLGMQKNSLKAGYQVQVREREFNARTFGYVIGRVSSFNWDLLYLPQEEIFREENISEKGFRIQEGTFASDSYTALSVLNAGYLMADQNLSSKLKIIYGARFENFSQKLDAVNYSGVPVIVDSTYADVLPSFNLSYNPSEKFTWRISLSKTISRPEFRELAPFSFYDFISSATVIGNDNLVRTEIINSDFRFEFYPGYGQMLSLATFAKKFKNPVELVVDASSGTGSRTFTYMNAPSAYCYGAEFEFRVKLSFLDSAGLRWNQWNNITLFSNLSWIRSGVDLSSISYSNENHRALQGQSPYIINAGIFYKTETSTTFSVLYNRTGRRITQVGSNGYLDIFEAPRGVMDIQVTQALWKNKKSNNQAEIKITGSDLLNGATVFYQDSDRSGKFENASDNQLVKIRTGRNYSVSFSYKF